MPVSVRLILFRDCKDIDTDTTREEANKIMRVKKDELINSPAYKKHTSKLQECFEGFDAMYICKPGDIDTREYDGNLDEVNDLFFVLMGLECHNNIHWSIAMANKFTD